jgi:ParB family chromosome partitioning protein
LAALIPEAGGDDRGGRVREIAIGQITANPYQPRTLFDPVALSDLENSIREHGVLQPILVREVGHERFQIVAGERRYRAARNVGLERVPAIVKEAGEREMLEMALVENVQREDIGALEAARAYERMSEEFGMTQDGIARRVGKSRSAVANTMRLLSLPQPVQESLERGEISEGHGRALLMAERPEAILQAWKSVVRRGLSVRDAERLAREARAGEPVVDGRQAGVGTGSGEKQPTPAERSSGVTGVDPNEARLVDDLQERLQTKVTIRRAAAGSGRIEIEFYATDDLERLADLLLASGSR